MQPTSVKNLFATLCIALATAASSPAFAAATYCVPGPNSDGLTLADVTFRSNNADNCYGFSGDNENAAGGQWTVNTLPLFGGNWGARNKDDDAAVTTYLGLNWDLISSVGGSTSGIWTLGVTDAPAAGTFPVTVDLLVFVKGGAGWAAFLFQDETFTTAGNSNGTYEEIFFNQNNVAQNYSHMTIYLREGTPPPPPCSLIDCGSNEAPEPGSLALLGLGLAVAGVLRRRRKH